MTTHLWCSAYGYHAVRDHPDFNGQFAHRPEQLLRHSHVTLHVVGRLPDALRSEAVALSRIGQCDIVDAP